MGGMAESYCLAERAEDYRMDAGDVTSADCVHADSALPPQRVFAASAVGYGFAEIPAGRFADIFG